MLPLALTALVALASLEGPFAELGYDAALAQAKEKQKLLLVDFSATWCQPCKKMEADTWRSADVMAWLGEHALAIQVDVDKESELAKRFDVQAMPTVVAIRDGVEFDRIVGYRDQKQFLDWAGDVLAGKRSSDDLMARAKELADSKDVTARYHLARDLVRAKQYDLALTHYLWLWPATREEPGMGGVRLSYMLSDMANLAKRHPPAKKAFLEILDGLQTKIDAAAVPEFDDWAEWSRMCDYFAQQARVLTWYEKHRDDAGRLFAGKTGQFDEDRIVDDVFDALMRASRSQDAVRLYADARRRGQGFVQHFEQMMASLPGDDDSKKELEDFSRRKLTNDMTELYGALIAAGRNDEAADVGGLLIHALDTPDSRTALVSAGLAVAKAADPSFARWLDEAEAAGANVKVLRKRLEKLTGAGAAPRETSGDK